MLYLYVCFYRGPGVTQYYIYMYVSVPDYMRILILSDHMGISEIFENKVVIFRHNIGKILIKVALFSLKYFLVT